MAEPNLTDAVTNAHGCKITSTPNETPVAGSDGYSSKVVTDGGVEIGTFTTIAAAIAAAKMSPLLKVDVPAGVVTFDTPIVVPPTIFVAGPPPADKVDDSMSNRPLNEPTGDEIQ